MTGSSDWLLFGAYGVTGQLLLNEALARGHRPVLAGRDGVRLAELAVRHGLEARCLSLDDPAALAAGIAGLRLVVNLAGPFVATAPALVAACLAQGIDYLDLAGEIEALRAVLRQDAAAQAAGVRLVTGAGFGVTLGDCLALATVQAMPEAVRLRLSIAAASAQRSPGARVSTAKVLAGGGAAVVGSALVSRPLAHQRWKIAEAEAPARFAAVPMAELLAAQRTTGVSEIVVGRPMPPLAARVLRLASPVLPVLARHLGQGSAAKPQAPVPTPEGGWHSHLWAEAWDALGRRRVFHLAAGEGYAVTATLALAQIEALLAGAALPGAHTPAAAFDLTPLEALSDLVVEEC